MNPHPINSYMLVTLEDEQPVEVIHYFNSIAVELIHDISYPEENKIRVDLTSGDVLYIGYSDYNLDGEGNVVRLQQFRADEDDPTQFSPMLDRFYTYDDNPNPQEELYLPFFANDNFPTLTFFSNNNILSYNLSSIYNLFHLFSIKSPADGEISPTTGSPGENPLFLPWAPFGKGGLLKINI